MDAKPKGKSEEIHPTVKKRYIAFAAIVILLAGVVAYFAFVAQAPVKTGAGPPTEVKTAEVQPNNPAVNTAATGAVAIPADALVIPGRNFATAKIPINKFPTSIFVDAPHTLYTNVKISSTAITGWVINSDYIKNPTEGTVERFLLEFYKGNTFIGQVYVQAGTGDGRMVGYSGKGFRAERPPETLGADSVSISV